MTGTPFYKVPVMPTVLNTFLTKNTPNSLFSKINKRHKYKGNLVEKPTQKNIKLP